MTKTLCALFAVAIFSAAVPAVAGNMGADEARRFVVGNPFSFTCFEGTSGEGQVRADGSVAGAFRFGGSGPTRYATLPPGTLRVRGDAICALISGMPFEVCFDLDRTGAKSFRGSLPAIGRFASCQFTRQPNRPGIASTALPLSIQPTASSSSRH
jgi:hypothetical protein